MRGWILTEIIREFFIWKTSDLTQGVSQYTPTLTFTNAFLKLTSLATCGPGLRLPRSASSEPLTSTRFRPGLKASYPVVFPGSTAALNSTYAQKLHFSPRLQPGTKNEQWRIRILWTWCHQWPKRARRKRCSASASTPCRYSC